MKKQAIINGSRRRLTLAIASLPVCSVCIDTLPDASQRPARRGAGNAVLPSGGARGRAGFLGFQPAPQRANQVLEHQRLLPTVGELVAVGTGHRIFLRTQLAQEGERGVLRRAPPPAAEA